ncbi:unnamed protein product, partial [Didymodactylos carnosus]
SVVQLNSTVDILKYPVICLPTEEQSTVIGIAGENGVAIGWGIVNSSTFEQPDALQQIRLPILDPLLPQCSEIMTNDRSQICAGGIEGHNTSTTGSSAVCTDGCNLLETLLDFHTIGVTNFTTNPVPDGYGNFLWTNARYMNAFYHNPLAGYYTVLCSGEYILYADSTFIIQTITNGTTFALSSLFACAAWNDNLLVTIQGELSGTVIQRTTVTIQPFTRTLVNLYWSSIDTVILTTSGGTHNANVVGGSGINIGIDDMCVVI